MLRQRECEADSRAHLASRSFAISLSYPATPSPALRRAASSGPAPVQQLASCPLIATAGPVSTPYCFAFFSASGLFMSSTPPPQEEHAIFCNSVTFLAHAVTPAL